MNTTAAEAKKDEGNCAMVELTGKSSRKGPDLTDDERSYLQRKIEKNGGSTTVDQLIKWLVNYRS